MRSYTAPTIARLPPASTAFSVDGPLADATARLPLSSAACAGVPAPRSVSSTSSPARSNRLLSCAAYRPAWIADVTLTPIVRCCSGNAGAATTTGADTTDAGAPASATGATGAGGAEPGTAV